jgi:hypothetical protein
MKFDVFPYKGALPLRFDMSQASIRSVVNVEYEPFRRTDEQVVPADFFPQLGLFVYYDETEMPEAFEFATGNVELFIKGKNVLNLDRDAVLSLDPDIDFDEWEFTSNRLGLSGTWGEEGMTSALVFRRGYYESISE